MIIIPVNTTIGAPGSDEFAKVIRTTEPLNPEQERQTFRVPPGFEVQLVAAEPDIAKPMNLAFDTRGRLWVSSSQEYPFPVGGDRQPRDTIKVLEDTDGDGRADRITTFADGLNIPIGLYPYRDGVICFSIPHIWFLRDTDGDGRADKREKLFGPFGFERDTHGLCNAFNRGFDGWLYACHGFNNESNVAGTDGRQISMQSGNTFRLRLDGSRIEHYTHGQVNPFGMAIDPRGDILTADCHTKPITLLLQGGYYNSFGKPHDGLGYVPDVMNHLHGSTAIGGIELYSAADFPPVYHGNAFGGNVMTSRINRNSLHYVGSTIRAREEPDFLISGDPWFRPVDIQLGPDGALYVADFYNRIIGHYEVKLDHPGRDRHRGRIWRIVYTGEDRRRDDLRDPAAAESESLAAPTKPTLAARFQQLGSPNLTRRLLAADSLVDEHGQRSAPTARESLNKSADPRVRLHCLWILYRLGKLTEADLQRAVEDADADVRIHAYRVLGAMESPTERFGEWLIRGFQDSDAVARRAAALAAANHFSLELTTTLLQLYQQTPPGDVHLRHAARMALRNQLRKGEAFERLSRSASPRDAELVAALCLSLKTAEAGQFLMKYVGQAEHLDPSQLSEYMTFAARYVSPQDVGLVVKRVRDRFGGDVDFQQQLLNSIQTGLDQRGLAAPPTVREWALELANRFISQASSDPTMLPLSWTSLPHPQHPQPGNAWSVSKNRSSSDGQQGTPLYSSFPGGEQRTGIYRSDTFPLPDSLRFFCCGHDGFPDKPLQGKNFVRLRDAETHAVLRKWSPPRNDTAQEFIWKAGDFQGRPVYLELVDGDTASAYAWLAVGRFSLPGLNPGRQAEDWRQAAALAARFHLTETRAAFSDLLQDPQADRASRSAIAAAVAAWSGDSRFSALAEVPTLRGATEELIQPAMEAILRQDAASGEKLVGASMRVATAAEQLRVAERLAADDPGSRLLIALVQSGRAAPRLLTRPTIQPRLMAVVNEQQKRQLTELIQRIPDEDKQLSQLIHQRQTGYLVNPGAQVNGAELFGKSCSICHQIAGKGQQVGPNLDGIGNRGLDRLTEDILAPNRNVDVAFRATTVVTSGGKVHSGLIKRTEGAQIILVDSQGKEISIPTADIDEQVKSDLSPMPANLGETLTERQFQDLLAYLLSLRGRPAEEASP